MQNRSRSTKTLIATLALLLLPLGSCTQDVGFEPVDGSVALVSQALGTSPDTSCSFYSSAGRDYWFCTTSRNWQTARTKCQAVGLDLVNIGSSTENQFILSHVVIDAWTAATDSSVEGAWRWANTNAQFWQGSALGSSVGGLYKNWNLLQPDNLLNQDCGVLFGGINLGKWGDESCTAARGYVCEGIVDECPGDAAKTAAGQCGCGAPDTDTDGDGTANCVDGCPSNVGKTSPGVCGCAVADTDSDGDAGEFAMLLEGIDAKQVRRRKRYKAPANEEIFTQGTC